MVEVIVTDAFAAWYEGLDSQEQKALAYVIDLLEQRGVALGYPYSSAIRGSRHAIRELRVQVGGRPFRVLYAFDPQRQAVLLIGGDKTGRDRFYEDVIRQAEVIWEQYLGETSESS